MSRKLNMSFSTAREGKVNTSFVDYSDLVVEHIQRPKHSSKTIDVEEKSLDGKVTKMQITRFRIPYKYNYAPPGRSPIIDDFYLQGPRMVTKTGIQCQVKRNYKRYSMLFMFDIQDPAQNAFLDVLDRIYVASGKHLFSIREHIGMDKFCIDTPDLMEKTQFKYIVYYRKDKGNRVVGSGPTWYVDLYSGNNNKTVFNLPTSNPSEDPVMIPWSDMTNVQAVLKPCFHIAFDRSGGAEAATVVYLTSAVVFSGKPAGSEARNKSSAYTSDVDEVLAAKADFEHIKTLNRRTQEEEETVVTSTSKSSFAGLTSTKEVNPVDLQQPSAQQNSFNPTQQNSFNPTQQFQQYQQKLDMTPHTQQSLGDGSSVGQQRNLSQLYGSFTPSVTSNSEPPALYSHGLHSFA